MGLIGGIARTAVIAGTATAVSNRVSRRQARRWQQQAYPEQAQAPYAPPRYTAMQPTASDAGGDELTAGLQRLAELHQQGVLTDDEFAAAKAKLLGT
jgi:hypothetical protein